MHLIPSLAVMTPIESTLVTSSYVSTPPTPRVPPTVALPVTARVPSVEFDTVAVTTPETVNPSGKLGAPFAFWFVIVFALILDSFYIFSYL